MERGTAEACGGQGNRGSGKGFKGLGYVVSTFGQVCGQHMERGTAEACLLVCGRAKADRDI